MDAMTDKELGISIRFIRAWDPDTERRFDATCRREERLALQRQVETRLARIREEVTAGPPPDATHMVPHQCAEPGCRHVFMAVPIATVVKCERCDRFTARRLP